MNGTETAAAEPPAGAAPRSLLTRALPAWFALAAFGQLAYLGHWPLYLLGVSISFRAAIVVALVRLGVYSGLAWGLATGQRAAWAGGVLELGRTFLLMVGLFLLRRWAASGLFYPASWAQGAVSGAMPLVVALNLSVARGWRPGERLETLLFMAAPLLTALSALAALALRREGGRFFIPVSGENRLLLREGLPLVLLLAVVEGGAFWAMAWIYQG